MKKSMLLIDMHNLFIRNWIVNPTKNSNGVPVGGIFGTLKSLQKFFRKFKPSIVFAIWDGEGSNKRKRLINKEYKEGRKVLKSKNYMTPGMDPAEEKENQTWQQMRIMEYFNNFPVIQLMEEATEADDIIAFIAQDDDYEEYQKIIISSDKDFLQLVSEDINVFFPTKDVLMDVDSVVKKYSIHPNNFVLARSIVGDNSDNLKGIRGAGMATIAKRFDFLQKKTEYWFENIYERCKESKKKLKVFDKILEGKEIIESNYKIMQLAIPDVSLHSKQNVKNSIESFDFRSDKFEIMKMMREDEFDYSRFYSLFTEFNNIIKENK